MEITLVTGISGSGKSVALRVLEDAGFFCVDNLPPPLIRPLIALRRDMAATQVAIAIDVRSTETIDELRETMESLRAEGHHIRLLFLTASNDALIARFSETRRSHPLSHRHPPMMDGHIPDQRTLTECIQTERGLMATLTELGHTIDTSDVSANRLKHWIRDLISHDVSPMTLLIQSFGFKHGLPLDADLVFDARILPNPYYNPALRPQTGRDADVIRFLEAIPEVHELQKDIQQFVEKWLPSYKNDNRSYLTVAIGCTGGQHRSVYLAEQLAAHFSHTETVVRRHRQLD